MAEFNVGDRVEMICAPPDEDCRDWCPSNGTHGTVVEPHYPSSKLIWVSWDKGADCWQHYSEEQWARGDGYYSYRLKKVEEEGENNMHDFKVGDRVYFIDNKDRKDYNPNKWTKGTVTRTDSSDAAVMWDEGANCWEGQWSGCWENGFGAYYHPNQLKKIGKPVSQERTFGDWIRCRSNEELAQIFAEHVDCCVCMNIMSKYGVEHRCDTGGCAEVWKKFLSKERMVTMVTND